MRRLYLFAALLLMSPSLVLAQNQAQFTRLAGWCEDGNYQVVIPGTQGSGNLRYQRSFPNCTVTVFDAGTTTMSTIAANATGTARPNPFTAAQSGQWFFYGTPGKRYDVRFSGGGIPTPFTLGDQMAPGSAGGGQNFGTFDIFAGPTIDSNVTCLSPTGMPINQAGSTTNGLQECLDAAYDFPTRNYKFGTVHVHLGSLPNYFNLHGPVVIRASEKWRLIVDGFVNYAGTPNADAFTVDSQVDARMEWGVIVGGVAANQCVVRYKPTTVTDTVITITDVEIFHQGVFNNGGSAGSGICFDHTSGGFTYNRITAGMQTSGFGIGGDIVFTGTGTATFSFNDLYLGHDGDLNAINVNVPTWSTYNTWTLTTENAVNETAPVLQTQATWDMYKFVSAGSPSPSITLGPAANNNHILAQIPIKVTDNSNSATNRWTAGPQQFGDGTLRAFPWPGFGNVALAGLPTGQHNYWVTDPWGGSIDCTNSTTRCLQEAINAAYVTTIAPGLPSKMVGYDFTVSGGNYDTGGGIGPTLPTTRFLFPAAEGKTTKIQSNTFSALRLNSSEIVDFSAPGTQTSSVWFQPLDPIPIDQIRTIKDSRFAFTTVIGDNLPDPYGEIGAVLFDNAAGTLGITNNIFDFVGVWNRAVGDTYAMKVHSPQAGANFTQNFIRAAHVHSDETSDTCVQNGDSFPNSGQVFGQNFYQINCGNESTAASSGMGLTGFDQYGTRDVLLLNNILGPAATQLKFEVGAMANFFVLQTEAPDPIIIDNNGGTTTNLGFINGNKIWAQGGMAITSASPNGSAIAINPVGGDGQTQLVAGHYGNGVTHDLELWVDGFLGLTVQSTRQSVNVGDNPVGFPDINAVFGVGSSPNRGMNDNLAWFFRTGGTGNPNDGQKATVRIQHFGEAGPEPILAGLGARGSLQLPAPVHAGDLLLSLAGRGFDGSANNMGEYAPGWTDTQAGIAMVAAENWDPTHHGAQLQFYVTQSAAGAAAQRLAMLVGDNGGNGEVLVNVQSTDFGSCIFCVRGTISSITSAANAQVLDLNASGGNGHSQIVATHTGLQATQRLEIFTDSDEKAVFNTGTGNVVCLRFASGMRLLTTNGTNITDGGPCPF